MRQVGDPYADNLAALIFGSQDMHAEPGSRLGYNKLVDIADLLDTDAELLLVEGSNFAKSLGKFPKEFQEYYDPIATEGTFVRPAIGGDKDYWRVKNPLTGILACSQLAAD